MGWLLDMRRRSYEEIPRRLSYVPKGFARSKDINATISWQLAQLEEAWFRYGDRRIYDDENRQFFAVIDSEYWMGYHSGALRLAIGIADAIEKYPLHSVDGSSA